MLTDKQKIVHKEFRKYLRTKEGQKGVILNNLINAAENNLPALIRKYFIKDFDSIYNDVHTLEELLLISTKIKSSHKIVTGQHGYISSWALEAYIRFYAKKKGIDLSTLQIPVEENEPSSTNDEEEEKQRLEGRLTEAKVLRRQRNRAARQKCLEDSNYICYVCGFNFEKAYGEIGKGFLEVHHTKPLATYDDEHPIPQSELCALCSNCHSMVHRKREVLDVDKLKGLFNTPRDNE